jgi:hypothetical protein
MTGHPCTANTLIAHAGEDAAYTKKHEAYIDKEHAKAEQACFSECVHTATDATLLIAAKVGFVLCGFCPACIVHDNKL